MKTFKLLAIIAFSIFCFYEIFELTINRIEVAERQNLLLRYKGPFFGAKHAKPGYWAKEGEVGVLEKMKGPGRYYYCPIWWERKLVDDIFINVGEIGIVTCKIGETPLNREFLIDDKVGEVKYRGTLRKSLTPGLHRINPFAYDVVVEKQTIRNNKHSGFISIPTGYVGVVTNNAKNTILNQSAGVQDKVLPPGIYCINTKEREVDIVGVGYWETSILIESDKTFDELIKADGDLENVEANIKGGISFPSNDGFDIVMDFVSIWGLMPDQAPKVITHFGSLELVKNKVILPQINSISRSDGSKYSATNLLEGKKREEFQNEILGDFSKVLKEKDLSLLSASVQHIYIPKSVRASIQRRFISEELKETRKQEQITAQKESALREAEKLVLLQSTIVDTETQKMIAEKLAEGHKSAAETDSATRQLVASINKDTENLRSQAKVILGKAESEGDQKIAEQNANKFKLAVEAFGTSEAYINFIFANGLPDVIDLNLFYAGEGTMWTDLKSGVQMTIPLKPEK